MDNTKPDDDTICFPTLTGVEICKRSEIIYFESANSQSTVFFTGKKPRLVICKSLIECQIKLKNKNFIRIHKKYLINFSHLKYYHKGKGGIAVMSDETELDVSPKQKQALVKMFKW